MLRDFGKQLVLWFPERISFIVFQVFLLSDLYLGCVLSPYLFNMYSEYIMRQANLEELDIGVRMGGRNINNLRYADDTTLLAESKEELLQLVTSVKEKSAQAGL